MDCATGRIVATITGGRDSKTFRQLWKLIEKPDRLYYTDDWDVYRKVIPDRQHTIGKRYTPHIESCNVNLRHKIAHFTRRTKVVSKSKEMVDLTLRLLMAPENTNLLSDLKVAFLSSFS